jgi:hypothetical protein
MDYWFESIRKDSFLHSILLGLLGMVKKRDSGMASGYPLLLFYCKWLQRHITTWTGPGGKGYYYDTFVPPREQKKKKNLMQLSCLLLSGNSISLRDI